MVIFVKLWRKYSSTIIVLNCPFFWYFFRYELPRLGTLLYLNSNERGVDSLSWTLEEISDCLGRKPVPCFGNASPLWPFHNLYLGLIGIKMVPTSRIGVLNTIKVKSNPALLCSLIWTLKPSSGNENISYIILSIQSSTCWSLPSHMHHHHQFVTVVLWRWANSPYPIHLILWGSGCTLVGCNVVQNYFHKVSVTFDSKTIFT